MERTFSLLYPQTKDLEYRTVSDQTMHDLGFDKLCALVAENEAEQKAIFKVLAATSGDSRVAEYRSDIFTDIYEHPKMCDNVLRALDKIDFLRDYGTFRKKTDEPLGIWDLMHRLEEINEYIGYVDAIHESLSDESLRSAGLNALRSHIEEIYNDNGYDALKKDIKALKATTSELKSVTLGINLNERFEANSIGLVSINSKPFTRHNILSNFHDRLSQKDQLNDSSEWDGKLKYRELKTIYDSTSDDNTVVKLLTISNPLLAATAQNLASVSDGSSNVDVTRYLDREADQLINSTVRTLRDTLNKYVSVSITDITGLIPEFMFYIRFAEYIRSLEKRGFKFCKPNVVEGVAASGNEKQGSHYMKAAGVYNMKLTFEEAMTGNDVVFNDLSFDDDHLVYILTGANRGGKTTITQAIGQLFILAQSGINVPGESFSYAPVDCIYTHFPADEDKTLDLGRLGEECERFRAMYSDATERSLLLLNETFSTTSFEEGYYIAYDSVRAIIKKGVRTIYNTHMHKLAQDLMADENAGKLHGIVSLITGTDNGKASFKIIPAPPEGMSYARNIAEKYGVTYEMLTE